MRWRALRERARGKLVRGLLRAPGLSAWAEWRYNVALAQHCSPVPKLHDQTLLDTLRRDLVATFDGSSWFPEAVLADARAECALLARDVSARSTVECVPSSFSPSVYAWGLTDDNLDLAESYIGLRVRYLGVSIKREKADCAAVDVRQWHLDVEDRRMLKLIVYLDAVGLEDGPFEYLDRASTLTATERLRYRSGFVSDARLAEVVEPAAWRQVTGPALTVAVVDTCRLLHRARPPRRRDRYSMSFSYCSERPHQLFPEYLPGRSFVESLTHGLSPRQRAAAASA